MSGSFHPTNCQCSKCFRIQPEFTDLEEFGKFLDFEKESERLIEEEKQEKKQ